MLTRAEATADRVRYLLDYDPLTGELTWKVDRSGKTKAGMVAGSVRDGRRLVVVDNLQYQASRIIWLWVTGEWPKGVVDHRNRITTDNRWENLRDTTQSVNLQNASLRSDNTSGVRGVSWHKLAKKWAAQIKVGGLSKVVGLFSSFDEAVAARKKAEAEVFCADQ